MFLFVVSPVGCGVRRINDRCVDYTCLAMVQGGGGGAGIRIRERRGSKENEYLEVF